MSFPLPDNIMQSPHVAVKEIMGQVKLWQSGALVESMQRMGINYTLNYGVGIPQLRKLAAQFIPDNSLAFQLFQYDIREAKILASMLFVPNKLSFDQLLQIVTEVNMTELLEQYSRNLFAKIADPMQFLAHLLTKDKQECIIAFTTLGWLCKFKTADEDKVTEVLQQNVSLADLVPRPFGFAMQSISVLSHQAQNQMLSLAETLCASEKANVQEVGREFIWLNK